jgi:transcriptional regulator with GAF, ATPase, and Fis domain
MFWRARSFWLAALIVAYVALAALRADEVAPLGAPLLFGRAPAWAALFGLPALLALAWSRTSPPSRGEDRIDAGARGAARACVVGAAILLASRTGRDSPGFAAFGNLGAGIASVAALYGLSRVTSLGGLIEPPSRGRTLEVAAFTALLWTVAAALPAATAVSEARAADLEPRLLEYATVAAGVASLGLAAASLLRERAARRLELGVAERVSAALLLTVTALLVGVLAAAVGVALPERVVPAAATLASLAIAVSAVTGEPAALSRALRTTLALTGLAAPPALLAVYVTHAAPRRAGATVFIACAACAAAGLFAPRIARRLAPEGSRWLDALDGALAAALNPDPDAALEAALLALQRAAAERGAASEEAASAALYRVAPAEVVTVDRAGYAHIRRAELPARLLELADVEPERVLRVEVARAVEVRRPELRPIVAWLEERGVAAVAVVSDDLSAIGLLTMPRGARFAPMTLEEVRKLRALGDRIGAVIGASASLARARQRELELRAELEQKRAEALHLQAVMDRDEGRLAAIARMLERPARLASYSPAARAAVEQIERLAEAARPVTLLSAPGVDAIAWAALAHLASPFRRGPLTVVDATSAAEHDLARWRDPNLSPLAAAAGGTLAIIDVHALPAEVQSYIGAALPEVKLAPRGSPGAPAQGTGVVVSAPSTVDALVALGTLSERLADRLGDRAVALPQLASRAEDLRALTLERLARIGVRLQSRPLGLHPRALMALLEHTWPGNDAELEATLLRAALAAEGDVIGVRELEQIGFPMPDEEPQRASPKVAVAGGRRRRAPR